MQKFGKGLLWGGVVIATALVLAVAPARATDISGTISSTLTITDNSKLVGNVTCNVSGAPCIQFGAPNITLDLNGFILTDGLGPGSQGGEDGIFSNGQSGVTIKGPGRVTRFREVGILVETKNTVEGVILSLNGAGIALVSDSVVKGNTIFNNGTGINILGNNNLVRHNEVGGNEQAGIFLGAPGPGGVQTGNLIEENGLVGNGGAGIVFLFSPTGNVVIGNTVLGNAVTTKGSTVGVDIFDPIGPNTYRNNLCEVFAGAAAGVCPNVPSFAGHRNDF